MILAGMKLRAGCLALRIRWVEQVERDRDEARASRDEARQLRQMAEARANGHQNAASTLDEQIGETERVLTSRGYPHPGGGENLALSVDDALDREASRYTELRDGIQAELRATGHAFAGDVVRAVDAAIDRERCGAQDFLEQVAREIGAPPARRFGRYSWPADTDELLRHVAKRRRDAEIGLRAIRDRDRAVQLLAEMLGKFAPDAFVAARAELEDLQGVSPSDHDEALAALVRRVGDVPREAYDPAMGGDIEPPPGREVPDGAVIRDTGTSWETARTAPAHDPELVERLAAMTPGDCDLHDYAVFAEGGSAGQCPWCEVRRTREVLAPDAHTWDVPLARVAMTAIDQNRAMAVAAELRWWVAPGNASGVDRVPRFDLTRRADQLHPAGATPEGTMPPRPDIWMAEQERMSEVPF